MFLEINGVVVLFKLFAYDGELYERFHLQELFIYEIIDSE
jgi:hypothetical protein